MYIYIYIYIYVYVSICLYFSELCTYGHIQGHTPNILQEDGVKWEWERGLEIKKKIREGSYIYR